MAIISCSDFLPRDKDCSIVLCHVCTRSWKNRCKKAVDETLGWTFPRSQTQMDENNSKKQVWNHLTIIPPSEYYQIAILTVQRLMTELLSVLIEMRQEHLHYSHREFGDTATGKGERGVKDKSPRRWTWYVGGCSCRPYGKSQEKNMLTTRLKSHPSRLNLLAIQLDCFDGFCHISGFNICSSPIICFLTPVGLYRYWYTSSWQCFSSHVIHPSFLSYQYNGRVLDEFHFLNCLAFIIEQ